MKLTKKDISLLVSTLPDESMELSITIAADCDKYVTEICDILGVSLSLLLHDIGIMPKVKLAGLRNDHADVSDFLTNKIIYALNAPYILPGHPDHDKYITDNENLGIVILDKDGELKLDILGHSVKAKFRHMVKDSPFTLEEYKDIMLESVSHLSTTRDKVKGIVNILNSDTYR